MTHTNRAQLPPVSSDHLSDVSDTWLGPTCGKFSRLAMIWKGTHLSLSLRRVMSTVASIIWKQKNCGTARSLPTAGWPVWAIEVKRPWSGRWPITWCLLWQSSSITVERRKPPSRTTTSAALQQSGVYSRVAKLKPFLNKRLMTWPGVC